MGSSSSRSFKGLTTLRKIYWADLSKFVIKAFPINLEANSLNHEVMHQQGRSFTGSRSLPRPTKKLKDKVSFGGLARTFKLFKPFCISFAPQ
jgi:hypothetical protein